MAKATRRGRCAGIPALVDVTTKIAKIEILHGETGTKSPTPPRRPLHLSTLTVHSRLDLGDLQDLLQILRPEVANSQRSALERAVLDERLEDLPEHGDLALGGDEGGVDEEEVGDEAEPGDGVGDGGFDALGGGRGCGVRWGRNEDEDRMVGGGRLGGLGGARVTTRVYSEVSTYCCCWKLCQVSIRSTTTFEQ